MTYIPYKEIIQQRLWETKELLDNRYVVVFGATYLSKCTIEFLNSIDIKVDAVIDNNAQQLEDSFIENICIYTPEEALGDFCSNAVILISSRHYNAMKKQLEKMGYQENIHIIRVLPNLLFSDQMLSSDLVEEYIFLSKVQNAYRGYKEYIRLREKYADEDIIFAPCNSLGDIYLLCQYNRERIDYFDKPFVTLVVGNGCGKVAKMFNMPNVEVLQDREGIDFAAFYMLMGQDMQDIKMPHSCTHHTSLLGGIHGYKGMMAQDLYDCILGVPEGFRLQNAKPEIYAGACLEGSGLIVSKTVVLSPYAKSVPLVTFGFWEGLAKELLNSGYTVCTNVNYNNPSEKALPGTIAVSPDINELIPFVEACGFFCGIRSGLCDLISAADCTKAIIFPHATVGSTTLLNFHSIKDMANQDNLIELECTANTDCISEVIQFFARR